MPNSSKECAICHIRWVQAFDRTETPKEPMTDVLEKQAGSGDMCLSCHDGSVIDSRFKVWSTSHHTTNSVPSESVKIPTDTFPLDDKGQMTCATCHTAHAVPDSSDLKTVIFLRKPNVDSSLCLSCHPEHAQKSEFQHPLGKVDYSIPQEIMYAGGKTSADGQTIICQTCHEPHGARNEWMLVLPPSKLCIACHSNKSPETNPPAGAPVHHIGRFYPGFEPPESLQEERAVFGTNGELSCLSCHRLHDASGAKPLLIRNNENSALCLDCHKKEKDVLDSPHDLRISSPETVNAAGKTALESGPCGACHRIHGWAREVPETNRPHSSGCMECHQSGGPGSLNRPYVDAHTVGTPIPNDMSVALPLDEDTNTIGCLTCHDPHSPLSAEVSTETADLTKDPNELQQQHHPRIRVSSETAHSEVQVPRSFLRYKGSNLCVLCHDKLSNISGPQHDPAMFDSAVRQELGLHPSIGSCRVCHTTHRAQGPHLWAHAPATDAGQNIDLCGSCHMDKMGVQGSVHDAEKNEWAKKLGYQSKGPCLDCHVVHDPNEEGGIWAYVNNNDDISRSCETCHRDGGPGQKMETAHMGKNIGNKFVNPPGNMLITSDRKITCTTCHDIHQKENESKLLIAPIEDLCSTCHEDRQGIQNSIHDPGAADWAKQLGFVSKGVCIDCHPPHGPKNGGVWSSFAKNEMAHAQSCESCHSSGGPGKAMQTAHIGLTLTHDPNDLPENIVVDPNRQILCVTCHNIHQKEQRPKLLTASRQDSGICLACHPESRGLIGTTHDLRVSAPEASNLRNETTAKSGPCGSCHLVHGLSNYEGLWAQGPIIKQSLPDAYCTSCHGPGKCAATSVPKYTEHPNVLLENRWQPNEPGYRPTFDKQGKPSHTGAISCLTCHEPHSASAPHEISQQDNMFLRPATHLELCADCHGPEALWRFLYYHKENRSPNTEPQF